MSFNQSLKFWLSSASSRSSYEADPTCPSCRNMSSPPTTSESDNNSTTTEIAENTDIATTQITVEITENNIIMHASIMLWLMGEQVLYPHYDTCGHSHFYCSNWQYTIIIEYDEWSYCHGLGGYVSQHSLPQLGRWCLAIAEPCPCPGCSGNPGRCSLASLDYDARAGTHELGALGWGIGSCTPPTFLQLVSGGM